VLYGLGGIGKTQLAIHFAKAHQAEFSSILFLDGSSQESLLKSFAPIYRLIIEGSGIGTVNSVVDEKVNQISPQEIAREVVQWLAQEDNSNWLLIFDNIDKEPSDEGGFDIMSYFPPKYHGSILITTRLAPLSRLGRSKRIGRMTKAEAIELLDQTVGMPLWCQQSPWANPGQESPATRQLLETLGGLPLAISQAGRFINTLNLKLETYLELYTSSKREVMDMLSSDSYLYDSEKSSIRTTWTISLNLLKERAAKETPDGPHYAAYHLLQLFAYFLPSDLNYNIIQFGLIGNDIPDWFRKTFSSKVRFFGVIKILLDLCLIDNNIFEGSYSMHHVVHDWLCNYVCKETNRDLLRLAVGAISYAAPLVLTNAWGEEQQQLAVHALHIFPRLQGVSLDDFFVRYDKMSIEDLTVVASLLNEPVRCWILMKFDCTLIGFARILDTYGRSQEASKLILEAKSKCPDTLEDGTMNPVHLLLRYSEISSRSFSVENNQALLQLSNQFQDLDSSSWAIKSQNLRALRLHSISSRHEAIAIMQLSLDQSRNQTGSVFTHPTWMVFKNLSSRISDDRERKKHLYEKFEMDAISEKCKVKAAVRFLNRIERYRR
jgi:NB-ARC domain